tara:strand:+ start:249 stop:401 length:153 start_codon:yes stop_codon:yes gene_type:complete
MEKFVITEGYNELHLMILEIFKDNKKVEVVMDRRNKQDKLKYKHDKCLFQ